MAGIGVALREARERAQLDIVDFEARTKIRAKYLRALEDEEWGLLPGYTFTKGFLRTYADMLGLDGRALVDEFKRQYRDPSELEPAAPSSRRDHRRARERPREHGGERAGRARGPSRPSRYPILIAVIVLVLLIVAALYAVGKLLPSAKKNPNTATHTIGSRTSHTHTHTTTAPPKHHAPAPTVVGVQLLPTGPVYVCMVGFPGASNSRPHVRLNGRTLTPGGPEPVYHDNHFHVTFGNGQVVMVVNLHRHPIAPSPGAISLDITVHGHILPLRPSQVPHCG